MLEVGARWNPRPKSPGAYETESRKSLVDQQDTEESRTARQNERGLKVDLDATATRAGKPQAEKISRGGRSSRWDVGEDAM